MLTEAKNRLLTQVGPGTPMGDLLRRYWMPVAGVTQFDDANPIRPIRLFGENLVLYRDPDGKFGLVDRYCAHRGADLSYGMVEEGGIRCSYLAQIVISEIPCNWLQCQENSIDPVPMTMPLSLAPRCSFVRSAIGPWPTQPTKS